MVQRQRQMVQIGDKGAICVGDQLSTSAPNKPFHPTPIGRGPLGMRSQLACRVRFIEKTLYPGRRLTTLQGVQQFAQRQFRLTAEDVVK